MNEKQEDYKKVSFDARLHYYPLLMLFEKMAAECKQTGDMYGYYTMLRKIFTNTRPWMRSEHEQELTELFSKVSNKLNNTVDSRFQQTIRRKIDYELTIIDDKIHIYAKDMYLPESGSDDDDVDWDKIVKRGRT